MVAADGNDCGVCDCTFLKDDKAGGTGAQIGEADAEFAFVGAQDGIGAGQRFEDRVVHVDSGAVHGGDHVLRRARRGGHHVDADFQPRRHHAQRIMHAALVVENELLRQQVKDFAVGGQGNGAGLVYGQANFLAPDFARARTEA